MDYLNFLVDSFNLYLFNPIYIDKNELVVEEKEKFFISNKKTILISQITRVNIIKNHDNYIVEFFERDFFGVENKNPIYKIFDFSFYKFHIEPLINKIRDHPNFMGEITYGEIYDNIC
jgi:hypothetical protein